MGGALIVWFHLCTYNILKIYLHWQYFGSNSVARLRLWMFNNQYLPGSFSLTLRILLEEANLGEEDGTEL